MTPFFVVDRPMSLNILKTFFVNQPGVPFGLMSHALVSENFRRVFASFPCQPYDCWLCRQHLAEQGDRGYCRAALKRDRLRSALIKIVDSGIFAKGVQPPYPELFEIYDHMGADYGVMKDVFGDARKTIESAKRAADIYARRRFRFKLILVAQGRTTDEYVRCSEKLSGIGIGNLAVGGLLVRKERSARYSSAGTMERMDEILSAIRSRFPRKWLFVLGCYHPKRHALFEKHSVFGSDYKGWIFNYQHRFDQLAELSTKLVEMETSGGIDELSRKGRERQELGDQAAELRLAYATTKNGTAKEKSAKAVYRKELRVIMDRIEVLDRDLVRLREAQPLQNGLVQNYRQTLGRYKEAVFRSDQDIRVSGVHDYLQRKLLPYMSGDRDALQGVR